MSKDKKFRSQPLKDMVAVGAVKANSARLWLRSEQPGEIKISWWPRGRKQHTQETKIEIPANNMNDNTCAVDIPDNAGKPPLTPLTTYQYSAVHGSDGHLLGKGRFETTPANSQETPSQFSIAVMSCNQPFNEDGEIRESARQMFRAAKTCLERHNTRLVYMVGDQMYSDYPKPLSLFDPDYFKTVAPNGRKRIHDCTAEEIRKLYHDRYHFFFNQPECQAIQAEYPCYLILDDHDIVDNWGSDAAHQKPEWQAIGEGARLAYFDYQGSRVLPVNKHLQEDFHYSHSYGHTATFVMDLRSSRKFGEDGQLYSDSQESDFREFLQNHQDKKVLFIVLSVPVVHLPRFLTSLLAKMTHSGEDFSDRWSSGSHRRDRDRFLKTLYQHQKQHQKQKIVILSGDIHIGCIHEIRWDNGRVFYQIISSPITHATEFKIQLGSKVLIRSNRRLSTKDGSCNGKVKLLTSVDRKNKNPYGGLNLGIVEVQTPEPEAQPNIQFFLYGHKKDEPVCVYRSPKI